MNLPLYTAVRSFLIPLLLSQVILFLVLPFPSFSPHDFPTPPGDQRVVSLWSGGITPTSAKVTAKISRQSTVRLCASLDPTDFSTPIWSEQQIALVENHLFVTLELNQLQAGTDYWYRLEIDGQIDTSRLALGHFKTFRTEPFSFDIAFGSCARTGSKSRIFNTIKRAQPDLYISTGDLHYGDIASECEQSQLAAMEAVLGSPSQANLFREVPMAYMWDDHDFGPDNSSSSAVCKESMQAGYQRYVPHYPLAFTEGTPVISQSFVVGRVRFLLTDLRSAKRRPSYDGCNRTEEGSNFGSKAHFLWFQSELLKAKHEGQLAVWISGIPFIGTTGEDGNWCQESDAWAGYPEEREQIVSFIQAHEIPVCILSGDAHMLAIDDGRHTQYAQQNSLPIPVFHAAPLDQYPSIKGGPYSHGTRAVSGQFGWMKVIDEGGDSIQIHWEGRDQYGHVVMSSLGAPMTYDFSRYIESPTSVFSVLEELDQGSSEGSSFGPNPNKESLQLRLSEEWEPSAEVRVVQFIRPQSDRDATE